MSKGVAMLLTGIAGVVTAVVFFAVVSNLVQTTSKPSGLSTSTFNVGSAKERAKAIAEGGPILFQDPLGRSRDIYLQHLAGEDWRAFDAHAPGGAPSCVLQWKRDTHQFADPCSGARFPADGTGMVAYKTTVTDKGRVLVDLRSPIPAPTTTTATPTSTSLAAEGGSTTTVAQTPIT